MAQTIAIIGGGASGALVVLTILKQATQPISILWFDATSHFGKGLAYSTQDKNHLLNVKASNMSAFADEPSHFINWLQKQKLNYTKDCFVPRMLYGNYIEATLKEFLKSNTLVTIEFIKETVVDLKKEAHFDVVTTHHIYKATKAVLAIGNFLPAHPRSSRTDFIHSENYFQQAFSKKLIAKSLSKKTVTIIGSGLTMIDVVLSLYHHHYKGKIYVISPHGYLPQAHSKFPLAIVTPFVDETKKYRLLELVTIVNKQFKKNKLNWHAVIDSLRPHLQYLWQQFSVEDKQQFLRHLRHRWGVARHRAPSESMAIIHQLIEAQELQVIKGRVVSIDVTTPHSFNIHFKNFEHHLSEFETDCIINCTGPESNFEKVEIPFIKNLLQSNMIEVDAIKYGIKANEKGEISENFYTLGPPLKGMLWESTAIPEIRVQANNLARLLI